MRSDFTEGTQDSPGVLSNPFADSVIDWTLGLEFIDADVHGFRFSHTATRPSLISTALAILIFELFGRLSRVDSEPWKNTLLAYQDRETGLFLDPLLSASDLKPGGPDEQYIQQQTTYFALNALDALKSRPSYPLNFIQPYVKGESVEKWLENLDWTKPWLSSNRIMFLAQAIIFHGENSSTREHLGLIGRILDWLDAHQDESSGFWGGAQGIPAEHAMAATYHFLPFYLWAGRRFQLAEKIIDSTLSLQGVDGLFHPSQGGDSCLDVDALDILVKCLLLVDYRREDVGRAINRIYQGLAANQEPGGGFCRARFRPQYRKSRKRLLMEFLQVDHLLNRPYQPVVEIWNFSGWKLMPFDIRQGDLWSTWFRCFGLGIISQTFPEKYPGEVEWKFRDYPALGWHDTGKIARIAMA